MSSNAFRKRIEEALKQRGKDLADIAAQSLIQLSEIAAGQGGRADAHKVHALKGVLSNCMMIGTEEVPIEEMSDDERERRQQEIIDNAVRRFESDPRRADSVPIERRA